MRCPLATLIMDSVENFRELVKANTMIAQTLSHMEENLKRLNDDNILHSVKTEEQHKNMAQKIEEIGAKYWKLIVALMAALIIVMGYKEIPKLFLGG
jgi:hypothetical protein